MPTFTSLGTEYLVSQTPWPYTKERNRPWYEPFMMAPFVRQTNSTSGVSRCRVSTTTAGTSRCPTSHTVVA